MSDADRKRPPHVLVLWNQTDEDVYEVWKQLGPQPLPWDPSRTASEVGTVQEEMDQLLSALRANGFRVSVVNVRDDFEKLLAAVTLYEPDVIFNLVEYFYDDETLEPHVAAVYDLLDVPYTGNTPLTLATCQSKIRTKILLEAYGLPTSPWMECKPGEPIPEPGSEGFELHYPLIVKPGREDASGGIEPESVVHDYESLCRRVRYVWHEFEQPALVEEYIDGREIHAAVLGNFREGRRNPFCFKEEWAVPPQTPEVLPLFEMEFEEPEDDWEPQIISYKAKWDPHSKQFYQMDAVCPAEDLDPDTEERIREIALEAYRVMGCRDYARIDMRVEHDTGDIYVLEVNPNPDLADGSAYVMCSDASGRTYAQLLGEIVRMALARRPPDEGASEPVQREPSDLLLREYRRTGYRPVAEPGGAGGASAGGEGAGEGGAGEGEGGAGEGEGGAGEGGES